MGIEEVLQVEIHRARWRREREACSLVNPDDKGFAVGRLPLPGTDPLVRLLIIPADPEAEMLALDDSFWEWFTGDLPDPGTGRKAEWGRETGRHREPHSDTSRAGATSAAAISLCIVRELWKWGSVAMPAMSRNLRPTRTMGRIWAAAAAYAELLERWPVEGPFQAVLGVRRTQGMILCDFGAGWAEPHSLFPENRSVCADPGLLCLVELASWPDQDGIQAFALSFGSWLEDAFGSRHRRYLARMGPSQDRFDSGRYGW